MLNCAGLEGASVGRFASFISVLVFTFSASAALNPLVEPDFERWLAKQEKTSIVRMLANVSPADAVPGVVIASPERYTPNYYFHWVRDAALTMDVVLDLYDRTTDPELRHDLRRRLIDYLRFSRANQTTPTLSGMGEPKFYVDGRGFDGPWCRPQNDGPALRALTLIRLARRLLAEGERGIVVNEIYDGKIPTHSVAKADLEFVAHHWRAKSCDIWEEVDGFHYYTRLVQRAALTEGALLASDLGDHAAARFYQAQTWQLQGVIDHHWDASRGLVIPTLNRAGGLDSKKSDIDSQVILAMLHANPTLVASAQARSTLKIHTEAFRKIYSINHRKDVPGVGIGRYPEDVYDGDRFQGGNPWVLTTAAFATSYYRIALDDAKAGRLDSARAHVELADSFLKRIHYHANPDGSLSEQFDRHSGYMTSARDLTWSHAEVLEAIWMRQEAKARLPLRK